MSLGQAHVTSLTPHWLQLRPRDTFFLQGILGDVFLLAAQKEEENKTVNFG